MPVPIKYHKAKPKLKPIEAKKSIEIKEPVKPITYSDKWNRPIPEGTIAFKHGTFWVVIIPPYNTEDVYLFRKPIPRTRESLIARIRHQTQYKLSTVFLNAKFLLI